MGDGAGDGDRAGGTEWDREINGETGREQQMSQNAKVSRGTRHTIKGLALPALPTGQPGARRPDRSIGNVPACLHVPILLLQKHS